MKPRLKLLQCLFKRLHTTAWACRGGVILEKGLDLECGGHGSADLDAGDGRIVTHAAELQLQLRQRAQRDGERQVACGVPATCFGSTTW